MQKNRTFTLGLILIIGLLSFISCQKEESVVKEPVIEEPVIEEPIDDYDIDKEAMVPFMVLKDIFSLMLQESIKKPGLFGLVNNQVATTRACPDEMETGTAPGTAASPYTLELDFDDCDPSGTATPSNETKMDGTITLTFEDPILDERNDEISVVISDGFKIGDYTMSDGAGDIELTFRARGPATAPNRYRVIVSEAVTITETATSNTTEIPAIDDDAFNFQLEAVGTNDPNNPLDFLDDKIRLRIAQNVNSTAMTADGITVTCTRASDMSTQDIEVKSTGTNATSRLDLQPFICSCIQEGTILIDGKTINFGYGVPDAMDNQTANENGCDAYARNTTDGESVKLDSCD